MHVDTPTDVKLVDEYEITTLSGMMLPVTIDTTLGDTFEETPDRIVVHLISRPSLRTTDKKLPAEDITVYKQHIISVNHRIREVTPLTPEQEFLWQQTLQEQTNKSIH